MPKVAWLVIVPAVSSLLLFTMRGLSPKYLKKLALVLSLIPLLLLLTMDWLGESLQLSWLPALGIEFYLKVDSLSLVFLFLTSVIIPTSLLAVQRQTLSQPTLFYGLVLLLQALLMAFFVARDLVVFTFFWESMLLPLYFIINMWGRDRRQEAAFKFLLYMIAGSILMIAAVLMLYLATGTFNLDLLAKAAASSPRVAWLFAVFVLAFAVKTPLFPFHAWLPDAYTQAPTPGTILLSAILSKAGIYGFLRIGVELFPSLLQDWSPVLLGFAIAGVFYGGFAAWMQLDYKRLLAYSSLSHVNLVLVGIFAWNDIGQSGAILQAVNHGITIAALFLVASWLEVRLETTSFGHVSGLAKFMPHLCWVTLFFVLSSVALPGLNNFIGEIQILLAVLMSSSVAAVILVLSVILSAIYMLRWMQLTYFQEPTFHKDAWVDLRPKEYLAILPLVALVLWIGVYPAPVIHQIEPAVKIPLALATPEQHP